MAEEVRNRILHFILSYIRSVTLFKISTTKMNLLDRLIRLPLASRSILPCEISKLERTRRGIEGGFCCYFSGRRRAEGVWADPNTLTEVFTLVHLFRSIYLS